MKSKDVLIALAAFGVVVAAGLWLRSRLQAQAAATPDPTQAGTPSYFRDWS